MYKVPMEMPKYCSECPFGMCVYSYPLGTKGVEVNNIDGQKDEPNTLVNIGGKTMEFTSDEINEAIKDIEEELAWANRFTINRTTGYARSLIIALKALEKLKEEGVK